MVSDLRWFGVFRGEKSAYSKLLEASKTSDFDTELIRYFQGTPTVVRSTHPYQLLIADDDSGFRETLQGVFEPYFVMIVVESGEEAIEIAESTQIDIALLDMHMQILTGLDTLRILKTLNVIAPCILITADVTDTLRKDAQDAEAYSVLAKPVTKDELVTTVSTAIEDVYDDPNLFSSAAS